jgi:hypothetical protein
MLKRTFARVPLFVLALVAVDQAAAWAVPGGGLVQCSGTTCDLHAQTPGSAPAGTTRRAGEPEPSTCQNNLGQQVSCTDQQFGTIGPDGCYLKPVVPVGGTATAAWYERLCAIPGSVNNFAPASLVADGQGPGGGAPAMLALEAARELRLLSPVIRANPSPGAEQMVGVSTWLWVDPGTWRSVSATAAVPGESVTATATPRSVVWRTGDGAVVNCAGPGTPYTPAANPNSPSPDCGHTYLRSSAGQPEDAFQVAATINWDVAWAGGGQHGVFLGLQTTATVSFRVAEAQAILTFS